MTFQGTFFFLFYERDSYSKVVESGEECNKGGGNRECSTRDHSSKTRERERKGDRVGR